MAKNLVLVILFFLAVEDSLQLQPTVKMGEAAERRDSMMTYNIHVDCPSYCTEKVREYFNCCT